MRVILLLIVAPVVLGRVGIGHSGLDNDPQAPLLIKSTEDLEWDVAPDVDATGHHLFNAVNSLLQLWPNTVVRPGHTIASCIIPPGTLLYHGKVGSETPTYPDWLAFDSEHGYLFARWRGGHILTFSTTRKLRMLYFDGSSGAKIEDGSSDTQELLMFGDVKGRRKEDPWEDEDERIETLCKWARQRSLDGFVRMEIDFEVMYCDMTNGLKLISAIEAMPYVPYNDSSISATISSPNRGPGSPGWGERADRPSSWRGSLPTETGNDIRVAANGHAHAPGETRVHILYDKIITFYDPAVTSLLELRRGKPREGHRVKGISKADADAKLRELDGVLSDWDRKGSGTDWKSLTHVVFERYAQRLETLAYTLDNATYPDVLTRATRARAQVLAMLAPHFAITNTPPLDADTADNAWLAPVVQRCASTHTAGVPTDLLTPQESLILNSIEEVMGEICRRLGRMLHAAFDVESTAWEEERVENVVGILREEVAALMEWLDWTSAWVKCRPGCSAEEMCVLPTWPYELAYERLSPLCTPRFRYIFRHRCPWEFAMPDRGLLSSYLSPSLFPTAIFALFHLHFAPMSTSINGTDPSSPSDTLTEHQERSTTLGDSSFARYERSGQLADLEQAIAAYRRAVDLTSDDHIHKADRSTSLARLLVVRYERVGELEDLDGAIALYRCSVDLTAPGHSSVAERLCSLGDALLARFERTGSLDDLNQAIAEHRRSVELSPDDHPDTPQRQTSLGRSLRVRFRLNGGLNDMEESVAMLRRAVEHTPNDQLKKAGRYSSLGEALLARFAHKGELEDLDGAIAAHKSATDLTPDTSPSKAETLGALGNAMLTRYERLGEADDLEQAVEIHRRAVDLTPNTHYVMSARLRDFGITQKQAFGRLSSQANFDEAAKALKDSMTHAPSRPQERLQSAQQLIELLSANPEFSSAESILAAHGHIIAMIPEFVWLGHDLHRRSQESARCGALVSAAVYASIAAGALDKAVEWLDAGRTVILSQALALRAPLDELQSVHPELASSLHDIQVQLQQSAHDSSSPGDLRMLAIQYERLIEIVNECPGFEKFMRPKSFDMILPSLNLLNGSVVFIVVDEAHCDALILSSDGAIQHVALTELSLKGAHELCTHWVANLSAQGGLRESELDESRDDLRSTQAVMEDVWKWIVKPVLQALDLLNPSHPGERLPHITWCPTGLLAQLPLHAAGMYSAPDGPRVSNYVVSSYTPSLALLLHCHEGLPKHQPIPKSTLIVAQSSVPGAPPLSDSPAESRQVMQTLSDAEIECHLLDHENATVASVQTGLAQYPWVHLACNTSRDEADATRNAFTLYDGPLSFADLLATTAEDAELAFLSANQTAVSDETCPEESLHLAAGMLVAGFKGVVATMWSIEDREPPVVVDAYYKELLRLRSYDTLERETGAAYALHEATKLLRERVGGDNVMKWATFVHFGA
ncbi:unnamed protein product [Peniophora sp. CBMAI 1063]|nr:unnamed protein product [Peniophora sp. CBMAI 1063]